MKPELTYTNQQIEAERAKVAEELHELTRKLSEKKAELAVIDRFLARLTNSVQEPIRTLETRTPAPDLNGSRQFKNIPEAVNVAIRTLSGVFSSAEVRHVLDTNAPEWAKLHGPSSISGTLIRMAERGEIDLVEKGAGKRPSKYRMKQ